MSTARAQGALPAPFNGLLLALIGGSVATVAFDLWGQAISPALGLSRLAPVPLAVQTVDVLTGIRSTNAGHFMHLFVVGLIAYPLGWLAVFRPLQERILPMHWFAASAIYGFGLFLVAIGFVAGPLLAGNPWFLNFTGIMWVALVGHVLYGIVLAATVKALEDRGF
ncbi:MAG: hypothetical protein AAF318_02895 [Pseudomonadota bacterium]